MKDDDNKSVKSLGYRGGERRENMKYSDVVDRNARYSTAQNWNKSEIKPLWNCIVFQLRFSFISIVQTVLHLNFFLKSVLRLGRR